MTSDEERKGTFIDTPALLRVVDTAPYLHDGSAATLLDVLTKPPAGGQSHGQVSQLDAQQLQDLVAFVKLIGSQSPRRRAVQPSQ